MSQNYQPSGFFTPGAFLVTLLATSLFTALTSVIYALAIWYIPLFFVGALAPFVWALLSAKTVGSLINRTKIRNSKVAGLVGLLGSLPGYYCSWVVWANLVINMGEIIGFGSGRSSISVSKSSIHLDQLILIATHPQDIIELMKLVNVDGLWAIKNFVVKGYFLWGVWALEFLVIIGAHCVYFARRAAIPFSEATDSWIKPTKLKTKVAYPLEDELFLNNLNQGDISYLLSASPAANTESENYLTLTTYYDPNESQAYLDIEAAFYSGKKNRKFKYEKIASLLQIRPDQAKKLQDLFA
ncbi:MAG: hypothetical protein LBT38_05485 [Deltaproteobacteria bacterium]|jgi:hypothetical protein|nr:hypothetical protein [Deltaproteobacteria bacterium]